MGAQTIGGTTIKIYNEPEKMSIKEQNNYTQGNFWKPAN